MDKPFAPEELIDKFQPGFSSAGAKIIKAKIFSQRVRMLHKSLFISVPASFVCSIIVFFSLYPIANAPLLWGWFYAVIAITLIRLISALIYLWKPEYNNKHYLNFFIIGTTISALLWGMAGSILMPYDDQLRQMIIIIIIVGITSGGMQTLQASRSSCMIFLILAILPIILWLFLRDSLSHFVLGVAILTYLAFMLMTSWRNATLLNNMLRLYFENIELVRNMAKINNDLKFEISQREKVEKKLKYMASHDALTGLANRSSFDTIFSDVVSRAVLYKKKFAILFVDIDNFKEINDSYGHDIGDMLLMNVAERLETVMRHSDMVVRLGGDEFIVLIEDIVDNPSVEIVTKRMFSTLNKPFFLEEHEIFITVSMGVSIYPEHGVDKDDLLKKADIALYQAKNEGKHACIFFGQKSS